MSYEMILEPKMFTYEPSSSELIKAVFKHGVVCIRTGRPRTADQLKCYGSLFGELYEAPPEADPVHNVKIDDEVDRELTLVSIGTWEGKAIGWHKDLQFVWPNYMGAALYMTTDSEVDTEFCYTLKSSLPLGIVKVAAAHYMDKEVPDRPFRYKHPITGIDLVYGAPTAIRSSETSMLELTGDREIPHDEYLTEIVQNDMLANNPSFRHKWKKYDVLISDNYTQMHRRGRIPESRILWRVNFNYDNISKDMI